MKKLLVLLFLTISVYANFLTDAGQQISNSSSIGGLGNILNSYGGSYLSQAANLGKNSILNNTVLGQYFKNHTKWASGTMSMCYEYKPSSNNVSSDICSMFSNININTNPCDALPDRIGDYYKKSTTGSSTPLSLQNWCKQIAGETVDQPLKTTITKLGVSGKSKSEIAGTVFNDDKNHYKKKIQDRVTNITEVFNSKETNADTKTQKTIKDLIKNGHEADVIQKIKLIANQTNSVSKNDTKVMNNPKIIFKNYKEYTADVEAATKNDYTTEKQLLDFQPLLKLANEQFISLNKEHKTLVDKMAWIDNEINKKRKSLIMYTNKKSNEEIMYELPKKLGYYHAFFNKDLVLHSAKNENFNDDAKTNILNSQIRVQEYEEKKIKLKWATFVDVKCNKLYISLKKIAIASEVFPKDIAMQEINQLLGEN